MDDLLSALLGLACFLTIVALVVHAVWSIAGKVYAAATGRELASPSPIQPIVDRIQNAFAPAAPTARHGIVDCPRCLTRLVDRGSGCPICNWPQPQKTAISSRRALEAFEQKLDRYYQSGVFDAEAYQRLKRVLREEVERLKQPAPALQGVAAVASSPLPMALQTLQPSSSHGEMVLAEIVDEAPAAPRAPSAPIELWDSHAATPAQRVEQFIQRQTRVVNEPAEPARPPGAARWSQWFQAFLEEKHIRWGELVGGLLIVCCSIALVLSFWSRIAEMPVLKFLVFNGVTASLFGLGFYSSHRWKLPTTSHGLFLIGSLLVPLNFLAIAAFTSRTPQITTLTIVGEVLSIGLFGFLLYRSGAAIVAAPTSLVIGVLGPSIGQLLIRRFVHPGLSTPELAGLVALPTVCYVASVAWGLIHARRQELTSAAANKLFTLLGIASLATLMPLTLLLARSDNMAHVLHRLAPLAALLGAPAMACGLLLWRKATAAELVAARLAGTSIALAGALVMLSSIVLAWPVPMGLLLSAVLCATLLLLIAAQNRIPAASLPAFASLSLVWLVSAALVRGDVGLWSNDGGVMTRVLLSLASGISLTPLVLLLAFAGVVLRRTGRRPDAQMIDTCAIAVAAVSLLLVSWHGLGRASTSAAVTWAYAAYSIMALLAAFARAGRNFALGSAALGLAALVQCLVFNDSSPLALANPWATALLLHATCMVALVAMSGQPRIAHSHRQVAEAWAGCGATTSLLAAGSLAWLLPQAEIQWSACHFLWLAAIWLALAWHYVSPLLLACMQTALALSVALAVGSRLQASAWFQEARLGWLDPWSIQAIGIALTLLVLAWSFLRLLILRLPVKPVAASFVDSRQRAAQLIGQNAAGVDRWLLCLLIATATGLAIYAALPGAAQELTPRRLAVRLATESSATAVNALERTMPPLAAFEVAGISHEHAWHWGSWLLIGVVGATLVVRQWERFNPWRVLAFVMLASLICPLVAARFEDQVATASALRWASALCFGLCSAAIWLRTPLLRASRRLGWPDEKSALPALRRDTVTLSMVLAAIPLIAMGTYVAVAAASNSSLDTAIQQRWNMFALLFLVVGGIGLTMGAAGRYAVDGRSTESPRTATWLVQGGLLLVILGAAPVVVVSLYVVSVALLGNPIVGPEPGTFFWRIGLAASYAIPVVLIALTLVGHAIRQRSSAFAFAASLLLNTSVTAAWLLAPVAGGLVFDTVLWVKLAQLNMLTSAAFAICWLAATGRSLRRAGDRGCDPFLATQVALPLALGAIVFLPALMALWLDAVTTAAHEQLGQPMGWAAVVTTLLALVWTGWRATGRISTVTAAVATLALSMTFCYWLAPFDRGNWLTWHGMAIALVVSAWCAPLVQWLRTTTREQGHHSGDATWTSVLGMSVVVLWSIRGGWDDPHRPWWSLGALAAMVALSAALACWRGRRRYLVAASLIVNLAATIGWLNLASIPNRFEAVATELLAVQAIALTLLAPLWLLLDLRLLRRHEHSRSRVAVHWLAAMLGLLLVAGLAALGVWSDFNRSPIGGRPWVAWLALASTAVAIAACLWDERVKRTTLGFYILGLTSVAMTLDSFDLTPDWLLWTGTIVMAAYASATSYLWSRRQGLLIFCDALGIPRRGDEQFSASTWLVAANGILVAMVLSLVTWIDFHFAEQSLRLLGGKAALVQALAVGLLARGEKRSRLQWAALSIGVLGTILWGWAWLEPDFPVIGLHRLVVVALALAAMSALYGIGLVKLLRGENEWTRAAGQLVPPMVALTCFSILAVLAWEIVLQATVGTVPLAWPAIVAVAAALVTVAVAALMAAALPGRDPLNLSPRGRTAYVYAAEVVLVLLLVHLRIAMPWLFAGMLDRYWPFIVMLIAFIGVALGEWFRRRSQLVLSEPLENTAALLPMLPVLGFWIAPVAGHYSMLLVAVGAMYATLATLRKSFGFGLLSALALNGALWSLLHEASGLGLARHPQLWFIPPALCVLGAAYLNRDRLSDTQMTQLRYLCSTVIYVSSTADIFLVGLSEAPWLPLVLAGLSIAGIFVGILLRVRGFLVLGSSFLVLALATMIWHAAWNLEQTWVWSASGIVAGMLIIALFAMFEKKRQDVLRLVDQLKEWEA